MSCQDTRNIDDFENFPLSRGLNVKASGRYYFEQPFLLKSDNGYADANGLRHLEFRQLLARLPRAVKNKLAQKAVAPCRPARLSNLPIYRECISISSWLVNARQATLSAVLTVMQPTARKMQVQSFWFSALSLLENRYR